MKLTYGRTTLEVADLAEASRVYCDARDKSGKGASQWPNGKVDGFHISYNGKVWNADKTAVIFDPYAQPQDADPLTYFGLRGFELWQTGGGCSAFGARLDDGVTYILLTDADNEGNPPSAGRPVMVGIYKDEPNGDPALFDGVHVTVDTFDDVIPAAEQLIATYF